MSPSTLPLDMFFNITEELSKSEDINSLKRLSLCCHSLLPLCQKHLFHTIGVNAVPVRRELYGSYSERTGDAQAFLENLNRSPHLANYVRRFLYLIPLAEWKDSQTSPAIAQVLAKLNYLEVLRLINYDCTRYVRRPTDWESIHRDLRTAILNVVGLPSFARLHLWTIRNFPLTALASHDKPLDIDFQEQPEFGQFSWDVKIKDSSHSTNSTGLRVERFSCSYPFSRDMRQYFGGAESDSTVIDFSQLKEFSVAWNGNQDIILIRQVMDVAHSLQRFRCKGTCFILPFFWSWPALSYSGVDVEVCFPSMTFAGLSNLILARAYRTLTTLELVSPWRWASPRDQGDLEDPLYDICRELESISGRNTLHNLHISLSLRNDDLFEDLNGKYAPLDRVVHREGFPSLKVFVLSITVQRRNTPHHDVQLEREELTARFVQEFPRLASMDDLDFQFGVFD
ncbi:hypothetical protein BDZ97DRAFT_1783148 [Flammula alnicola]|nr:hypothetical protein BDZ97DRAFT_1783148 [Flammula alnicola]